MNRCEEVYPNQYIVSAFVILQFSYANKRHNMYFDIFDFINSLYPDDYIFQKKEYFFNKNGNSFKSTEFLYYFYTGISGFPTCAGITDCIYISCPNKHTITWKINIKEYKKILDIDLNEGYLQLNFNRDEYESCIFRTINSALSCDGKNIQYSKLTELFDDDIDLNKINQIPSSSQIFFYLEFAHPNRIVLENTIIGKSLKYQNLLKITPDIEIFGNLAFKYNIEHIKPYKQLDNKYEILLNIIPIFPFAFFDKNYILSCEELVKSLLRKDIIEHKHDHKLQLFSGSDTFIDITFNNKNNISWNIDLSIYNNKIVKCDKNTGLLRINFSYHQYKKAIKELLYILYYTSKYYVSLYTFNIITSNMLTDNKYNKETMFVVDFQVPDNFSDSKMWDLSKRYVYKFKSDFRNYMNKQLLSYTSV